MRLINTSRPLLHLYQPEYGINAVLKLCESVVVDKKYLINLRDLIKSLDLKLTDEVIIESTDPVIEMVIPEVVAEPPVPVLTEEVEVNIDTVIKDCTTYTDADLRNLTKSQVVEILTQNSLDPVGSKEDLIKRVLDNSIIDPSKVI
jgi:hypothetical protein